MPVVCNDRGLSSCESASDSVHRPILWTFQFATETGTGAAYGGGGGDEGAFLALGHFSRSSRYLQLSASGVAGTP